ncbi:hypothetical protein GN958_ATG06315 [Phytophthora infestans]|uniref:Uncharacterized protein n=1 Tax=Phytophthora infestans TaxID=4787 RepID=A0A8S9UXI2_PHYIN|nr:hypothetical protein GN958_ATG06315 [Phytophthora infestans]
MVLNHTPFPSLGGVAPVTAMTGIPAIRPGDTIFIPGPIESVTLDAIQTSQLQNVERVQQALVDIH